MNREILFRGKSIDNRFTGWVEGFYLEMELCDGDGRCSYIKMDGYNPIKVDPETVGQSTGLKDKKGNDIYEGDIITSDGIHRRVIEWNSYECKFNAVEWGILTAIILGNIYDNPSLLK